jgi:UrcA family protein
MNRTEQRAPVSAPSWVAALSALCFALSAFEAQADPTDDPPTITVKYSDLNIDKPAGARVLYRRIASAARTVCGVDYSPLPSTRSAALTCYRDAIADAVSKVDSPTLAGVHQARWKESRAG